MNKTDKRIDKMIEKGYTENQIVEALLTKPRVTEGIGSFLKTLRGKAAVKALSKMIELSGSDPTSEEEVYNFLKKNAPKESDDGHRLGAKVIAYMASGDSYEEAVKQAKEEMGQTQEESVRRRSKTIKEAAEPRTLTFDVTADEDEPVLIFDDYETERSFVASSPEDIDEFVYWLTEWAREQGLDSFVGYVEFRERPSVDNVEQLSHEGEYGDAGDNFLAMLEDYRAVADPVGEAETHRREWDDHTAVLDAPDDPDDDDGSLDY